MDHVVLHLNTFNIANAPETPPTKQTKGLVYTIWLWSYLHAMQLKETILDWGFLNFTVMMRWALEARALGSRRAAGESTHSLWERESQDIVVAGGTMEPMKQRSKLKVSARIQLYTGILIILLQQKVCSSTWSTACTPLRRKALNCSIFIIQYFI